MVEVNGSMVPPLGQEPQGPRSITFERVKDNKGKPVTLTLPGDWHKSDDGPKNERLGSKKRYGKWAGGCISVEKEPPPPDDKNKKTCIATIYLHLTLVGKGCSATDVNSAMDMMERGARKLGGTCPCAPPPDGEEHDRNDGRSVKVVIIWHPKPGGGIASVKLDCGAKAPHHGEASSEAGTIEFDGNMSLTEGPNVAGNASLCAHEMGHLLFGTGSQAPDGWDGDHNPDGNGLMRDTEKNKEAALTGRDKTNEKENCILCSKAGLKVEDCCTYKKKAVSVAIVARPVESQVVFQAVDVYGTS